MPLNGQSEKYRLIYWPEIPGRGEPIRLAFEQAGASYEDVALEPNGVDEVLRMIDSSFQAPSGNIPAFAPPILEHNEAIISQLPNIMFYLGPKLGLTPSNEMDRFRVNQVFLTICDLQNEAHDTHHPIAVGDYYENQRLESFRRSVDFRLIRLPKFFSYFERLVADASNPHLVGDSLTYADLAAMHVIDGLKFAYPNAMAALFDSGYPKLNALYTSVKSLPKIKSYLESDRRKPFSMGLYRHYKELDDQSDVIQVKNEAAKKEN